MAAVAIPEEKLVAMSDIDDGRFTITGDYKQLKKILQKMTIIKKNLINNHWYTINTPNEFVVIVPQRKGKDLVLSISSPKESNDDALFVKMAFNAFLEQEAEESN